MTNGTLTIVTMNVRGVPFSRPSPALRAAQIGHAIEGMAADVVNLQEVHSYRMLHALRARMPSLRFMAMKRGLFGPAGGLVTLTRHPIETPTFHSLFRLNRRLRSSTLPALTLGGKGMLVTRLAGQSMVLVNVHLSPNKDGDWSRDNRFWPVHQAQLRVLARLIATPAISEADLAIICGDFNIAKDSDLIDGFMSQTGVHDAFEGDLAPTFHLEFLEAGRRPHCIDYILIGGSGDSKVASAEQVMTEKVVLADGTETFPSDHVGLCAKLIQTL
jgi:endonuclease/exonuclease/phosphatase family metal-dependent hydrolase